MVGMENPNPKEATTRHLRNATQAANKWLRTRDDLIVELRRHGATVDEIAAAAGLTRQGVKKLLDRRGEWTDLRRKAAQ